MYMLASMHAHIKIVGGWEESMDDLQLHVGHTLIKQTP